MTNKISRKPKAFISLSLATISLRRSRNITLAFSADLCYNGVSEKPPSEREVARRSRDGRSLRGFWVALTSLYRTLPQSPSVTAPSRREPIDALVHL